MDNIKEILVISEYFAPQNSIASIRFTKVLKYLSRKNKYHFVVITRKFEGNPDPMLQNELREMGPSVSSYSIDILDNIVDKIRNRKRKIKLSKETPIASSSTNAIKFKPYRASTSTERLYKLVNTLKYIYNEMLFARRGIALINSLDIRFDCIVSSYGDAGSHLLALKYLKKFPDIRWIADYRDPAITYYRPPIFNPFFDSILNKSIKKAHAITGVNKISMGKCANTTKSFVIINGFDSEDREEARKGSIRLNKEKFHICYTGRIYGGKSDARILFKAIHSLGQSGEILLSDFQIDYAGSNFDLLYHQAAEFDLTGLLVNHGYVQRRDSMAIQNQSQILLVLSWNDDDEEDVLTGKFMEYLLSERNILAIVKGNKLDCSIYRIINASNSGFCYEEARGDSEYKNFKRYILELYQMFKENGEVTYRGNPDVLKQFDYKNIADEFEMLIL